MRDLWRARVADGFHYHGPADFVLREGRAYEPAPLPEHVPQGGPKLCYANSLFVACGLRLPYIEGFACAFPGGPLVQHAWNEAPDGRVIDSTWPDLCDGRPIWEDRCYMGVRFSAARADEATWDGDATVLDDYNRGWPILREPWAGEDSPGDVDGVLDRALRRYAQDSGLSLNLVRRRFAARISKETR
jgi:hypothetical protein